MKWNMIIGSLAISLGLFSQSIGQDLSNRVRGREIKYSGNSCSEPNYCEAVDSDESSCCKQAEEPTCEEPTCEEPTCEDKGNDAKCCKHKRKRTGPFSQMFKTHKKCKPADCDKSSCCKQPEDEEPDDGCLKCCKTTRNGLIAALESHHKCRKCCNHSH